MTDVSPERLTELIGIQDAAKGLGEFEQWHRDVIAECVDTAAALRELQRRRASDDAPKQRYRVHQNCSSCTCRDEHVVEDEHG